MQPYFCRHCRKQVGSTDGNRLVCGSASFANQVAMDCANCGKKVHWHPAKPLQFKRSEPCKIIRKLTD